MHYKPNTANCMQFVKSVKFVKVHKEEKGGWFKEYRHELYNEPNNTADVFQLITHAK